VLTAAGLGQTAAHHVADAEQHDEEPCPVGLEVVGVPVGGLDQVRHEQHADDRGAEDDQFSGLERSLGLAAAPARDPSRLRVDGARCVGAVWWDYWWSCSAPSDAVNCADRAMARVQPQQGYAQITWQKP
jgi:hypothetical protein